MAGFAREFVRSLRQLWQSPGFTWPIIAALTVGIGATTSVFSVFSAMLLRPMGFSDSDCVMALWDTDPEHGSGRVEVNYRDLQVWRTATQTVENAALVSSVNLDFTLFTGIEPHTVDGAIVSGSFFRVTGTTPFAGRLLNDDDDRPGAPPRVVLSHALWHRRFAADFGVIGREVRVGTDKMTVIGIAQPEFDFPRDVGIWIPIRATWPQVEQSADLRVFRGIARLRKSVSTEKARVRLNFISRQTHRLRPAGSERYGVSVTPILDEIYGSAKSAVQILLGAVFLVLLIACSNAANLLLARANARGGEIAIRIVLGAGRTRVMAVMLAESACLGATAGLFGMLLALFATKIIAHFAPLDVARIAEASVDLRVFFFGVLLTCSTVLVFGIVPALVASERDPNEALKQSGPRSSGGMTQVLLRRLLIITQVAFSSFLLIGAGLLARSYRNLAAINPGFQPQHVLTFRVTTEKPDEESRRNLYRQILDRLRVLPGLESAAAVLIRPLSGAVGWDTDYAAEGQPEIERRSNPNGNYEAISPGYFRTMGIRLIAGRDFTDVDNQASTAVAIVNAATARRHWPQGSAIGRRVRLGTGPRSQWATVVGVADDVRYREWEAARPDFYVPFLQRAQHRTDFVVKTRNDPRLLAEAARRAILTIDKNQPISNVTTMDELVDRALARSRFNGVVLGCLAGSAIILAALGIFSMLSYMVGQSAFEIALRMAVGAMPAQVARMIALRGMRLVITGGAIGLGGAALASKALTALLFGVSAVDPLTYGAASAILILSALTASLEPALRASAIDPIRTLRSRQ